MRSAADLAAEIERRTAHDLDAWTEAGDRARLQAAVRRYLLGPRIVWTDALTDRMRHTLRDLYDRAESVRLPHGKITREMTARQARDILAKLLLPPGAEGRPSGSAPIIAHAVETLIMVSDRRSVEALLADDRIVSKLRARLVELGYGRDEVSDLLCDGYDALTRAYRRRVRGR